MTTGNPRPTWRRSRLARGLLPVLVLFGLFLMHAIGPHGTPAGHLLPTAHGATSTELAHHAADPTAAAITAHAGPVVASPAEDGDQLAMAMICVAMLLLASLLFPARTRLVRGGRTPRLPRLQLRTPAAIASPPLLHVLCVSRT